MNDIWFINIFVFVIEKKIYVVVLCVNVVFLKFGVNYMNGLEMVFFFDCRIWFD